MLKANKGCGIYRNTLQKEARDRYLQKMSYINGLDPYEVPTKEWRVVDDLLPNFAITNVFAYLVCGVSAYTYQQFHSYKSLEAYKQLTSGQVHDMEVIKPNENTVVRAKVIQVTASSYRLNMVCSGVSVIRLDAGINVKH